MKTCYVPLYPQGMGRRLAIRLSADQSPSTEVWFDVALLVSTPSGWRRIGDMERMPLVSFPIESGRIAIVKESRETVSVLYAGQVFGRGYWACLVDRVEEACRPEPRPIAEEVLAAMEHLTRERL